MVYLHFKNQNRRKYMKRIILFSLLITGFLLLTTISSLAQRGDDTKRSSKNGKVEATIDGVKITIEYGRPKVNNRKIWGALVPYNYVWRTGADEATTFTIDKDITVEGKKLAAGSYSLFTVPSEYQWVFLFNKIAKQWGAFKYDGNQDALRVKVTPRKGPTTKELTFKIKKNKVNLYWDKLRIFFTVAAAK
jgi:Protein of unknown function (DUF2911)